MKNFLKKIITALLQWEARLVLKKYRPKIVAVTGSVGKTSTKDAIYTVLATTFFVRKSSKSFNSEIGVPLTILGLQNAWNDPLSWLKNLVDGLTLVIFPNKYPEWLVIEVGADRPGDIRDITSWLHPDIAVVTRLSKVPVHVEFFDSAEQVRHEKSQLVLAVKKTGTVILNADDKLVSTMRPLAKGRVVTYGAEGQADVTGKNFEFSYGAEPLSFPTGISFEVSARGVPAGAVSAGEASPVRVEIAGALGRQQMSTFLAALAVAKTLGISLKKAAESLRDHESPPGRMRILAGANGSLIIDDTYNSSPVAASQAVETLKAVHQSGGRKIALLGDMMELGSHSPVEHQKIGALVARVADVLYTVGTRSKAVVDAAVAAGFPADQARNFSDSTEAGKVLRADIRPGDIVLAKGSQSIRMEKAVAQLLADPVKAGELLVRQEKEWQNR